MIRPLSLLLLLCTIIVAATSADSSHGQQVLRNPKHSEQTGNPRKLKGKFLHITDLHPDPFYRIGAPPVEEHPCHKGKGNSGVGYYGAATSECDSPLSLINATFEWIEKHIKDEIDFVVWTGDSARHDNDEDIPRSDHQVADLNRYVVRKFVETFGKPDNINDPDPTNDFVVPIIPTLGNNDILPHNIFAPGPNAWTRNYIDIWRSFVPEEQKHSFARGGWFWTEVIPNRLGVVSLNTLYFFDKNSAVDGCDLRSEPGYEHMEWLRVQLQFMRERGMKAILIGHVPPARTEGKQAWDDSCYQKFVLWQRQYRDVITANLFGHMNIDHFMFHDVKELKYKFRIDGIGETDNEVDECLGTPQSNDTLGIEAKSTYLNELRMMWNDLPTPPKGVSYNSLATIESRRKNRQNRKARNFYRKIGGPLGERFSMSIVSPSIVPNYFPTLRIIEYNMTGLENDHPAKGLPRGHLATEKDLLHHVKPRDIDQVEREEEDYDNAEDFEDVDDVELEKKKKKRKGKKGRKGKHRKKPVKKPPFLVPAPPSATSLPGPAYLPQTFSLLSWTQLYANLTSIHEEMAKEKSLDLDSHLDAGSKVRKNYFKFETEYTTSHDGIYNMPDLTMKHWLGLAERIGRTIYKNSDVSLDELDEDVGESFSTYEFLSDSEYDDVLDVDDGVSDQRKKKKKKKKNKSLGKFKDNELWHEFVRRAFVHSKSDGDLEDEFN